MRPIRRPDAGRSGPDVSARRRRDVLHRWPPQWAELVAALSGSVRDQVDRVTEAVAEHADAIADLAVAPARAARERSEANTSSVDTE